MEPVEETLTQSIITTPDDNNSLIIENKPSQNSNSPKSSLNAVMFGLMASAMGTGIFNLPLRITEIGLIMFLIYVLLAALFSFVGAILIKAMVKKQGYNSYSEMSDAAFGPFLKIISQISLILFPWGICVCFQVIIAKFMIQLLVDVFGFKLYENEEKQVYNRAGNITRIIINLSIICTDFVLIAQKSINILQRLSVIGVAAVLYNALTILLLFLFGFTRQNTKYVGLFHISTYWDKVQLFIFNAKSFSMHSQAFAAILFCYINHQLIFPACKNMENPTDRRLTTCFKRACFGQMTIYYVIGLSGYLLLVEHEDKYPIGSMVLSSIPVWPMALGKFLIIITLYLAIPLNMFPARTILSEALKLQRTNQNHYILSIVLAASSCLIAITFVQVNSYFGLLGGTAGVLIGGTIPALCYAKLIIPHDQSKNKVKSIIMVIFCGLVTVIGFSGAILSVVDPV